MTDMADLDREAQLLTGASLVGAKAPQFASLVSRLWDAGLPSGTSTGWPSLDHHYTVAPGQMTIVTGWPGSGKSEWLDAMLLNLAFQGWRIAMYSPENRPEEVHVVKYLEKLVGKPFRDGPTPRMSKDEAKEAMDTLSGWFSFLVPSSDTDRHTFGLEDIMNAAELAFRGMGAWKSKVNPAGLVIDPWNELEHQRPRHWSETEYISHVLTTVRSWARANKVHVWIVAHPQKLRRDDGGKLPIPRPDAISGSQHWWNKADNCVTVWRPLDDHVAGNRSVDIHVQKVRFKHIGTPGVVTLEYDRITGRYSEPSDFTMRIVK